MIDYDAIGYYPDDGPSLILQCPCCAAHIEFYENNDAPEHIQDGAYQLREWEYIRCACGATFGEGDWIDVVTEP